MFSGTVEEQHVPYINPCENGGKADVRWMALRKGEGGTGVLLRAGAGAPFDVSFADRSRQRRVAVDTESLSSDQRDEASYGMTYVHPTFLLADTIYN